MKYIYTTLDFPEKPVSASNSVRVYLDLEGVLANFTVNAALALDNFQVPINRETGIISPNPLYSYTTEEVMFDICHGFEFYRSLPTYQWTDIIFEETYKVTNGNVFFVAYCNKWDRSAWGGKAQWIWEHFGDYGYNHLLMGGDKLKMPNRIRTTKDILIDDDINKIKHWCLCGGTGFHWPEMDWRVDQAVSTKELIWRLSALKSLIKQLNV